MSHDPSKDVRDELRHHREELVSWLQSQGMSREDAEKDANVRFGDPDKYHDATLAVHDVRTLERRPGLLTALRSDLRFALRTLVRAPGFTAVVVLTLALGIGANTAIFSVIRGVLLRPLAFTDPDRLVTVWDTSPVLDVETSPTSVDTYFAWKDGSTSFSSLAAWTFGSVTMEEEDAAFELTAVLATGDYLTTLGVTPMLGRILEPADEVVGRRGAVVMLSHQVWQDRFGADPMVIGTTIQLDGNPTEVVGVMPPHHLAPNGLADLWLTTGYQPRPTPNHGVRRLLIVGRLAPDATVDQARAEVSAISDRIAIDQPTSGRDWTATAIPMREHVVGSVESSLTMAFGAVALLLLIACINVANLLLARAASRDGEIALRSALGAGRARLARQLLTESVLLAAIGGAAGIVVAVGLHRILLALEPGILPRLGEVRLDFTVLAFGLGLAVITGIVFGLAPVFHAFGVQLATVLRQGGRGATTSAGRDRARHTLVVGQVALTLMLLTGAGLLTRTFIALRSVDPGFRAEGAVAARMFLDGRRYTNPPQQNLYYKTLLDQIRQIPGVTAAGATSSLPMDPVGINFDLPFRTEATAGVSSGEVPQADFRVVSDGYFEAMGVRLVSGRFFNERDLASSPRVILVNRTMAEQNWPGENPVGRRVQTVFGGWFWYEVVGVVDDTRYYGLDSEPRAEMYVSEAQNSFGSLAVVAHTNGDPGALTGAMTAAIHEIDPQMPANSILPVTELIADSIATERFYATLLAAFAVVAMLLAAAGVYGVLSYWVSERQREIGVRIALGAGQAGVVRMVVGNGMRVTGLGIVLGIVGSVAAGRLLATMLFGVAPFDPVTIGGVSVLLAVTAFLASYLPAFRAGRVDPIEALRE